MLSESLGDIFNLYYLFVSAYMDVNVSKYVSHLKILAVFLELKKYTDLKFEKYSVEVYF